MVRKSKCGIITCLYLLLLVACTSGNCPSYSNDRHIKIGMSIAPGIYLYGSQPDIAAIFQDASKSRDDSFFDVRHGETYTDTNGKKHLIEVCNREVYDTVTEK